MKPTFLMIAAAACLVAVPAIADAPQRAPASTLPTSRPTNAADLYRQAFALLDGLDAADHERLGMCGTEGCWVVTTPLDKATADLIARKRQAVLLARTAAALPEVRWDVGTDANKMIEMSTHVPVLSALLVLRARHELQAEDPRQGLDDLMAALALSRHAASDRTIMGKYFEVIAQRPAIDVLAQHLPDLPRELVAALPARLDRLPKSPTMPEVILGEYEFAKKAAVRQGLDMMEMVAGLKDFFAALANGGSLSPSQFAALVDEQTAKYSATSWAGVIAPVFKSARGPIAAGEARRALLKAAVDIVLQGEASVKASKDPFGNGPFAYRKLPNGFELSSELKYRDKAVTLRVGL